MPKLKVSLLTIDEKIALFFKKKLLKIFGNIIEIKYYTSNTRHHEQIHNSDLILYTDPSILIELMNTIKCDCPILMMKRTISKSAVDKINRIPTNSRCLVANINSFMANETLANIYQLGFKDINLMPVYPNNQKLYKNIDYIITHEKYDYLKKFPGEIIVIGNRIFDINTILDIISILDIDSYTSEKIILEYSLKIPNLWKGINYTLKNKRILSSQWKILLNELSEGVMIVDNKNKISLINKTFKELIGKISYNFEGLTLSELKTQHADFKILCEKSELESELFIYNNKKLILTIRNVIFNDRYYGKIILIGKYQDIVKIQQKIHKKIIGKGYYSKYNFDSIITKNNKINDLIEISKKIANSDSSVLISGDSGTGKELFAGSIHNYSNRSNKPFVALNCAAIPDNLIESELFGYEEGSFTGAKQDGKIGLFESADGGTLFLDEISEMPLKLQGRLLRVLQEKEIMRIGGDSIIRVNTRIIAATNKNLWNMVNKGSFRKDLFFRLNIFNLELPPLSERKDDIKLLLEYFLKKIDKTNSITKSFLAFAQYYKWPGNIRELFNILEYMTTISNDPLYIINLPSYLKKEALLDFKIKTLKLTSKQFFILFTINKLNNENKSSGRRSVKDYYNKKFYKISEIEVRKIINYLVENDYIKVYKGPKGNVVANKGREKINENIII